MCTGQLRPLMGNEDLTLQGINPPPPKQTEAERLGFGFNDPTNFRRTRSNVSGDPDRDESLRDVGGRSFSPSELFFQDFGRRGTAEEVASFDPNARVRRRRNTGETRRTSMRARSGESAPVPFDINASFETGVSNAGRTAARGGFRLSTNQLAVRNNSINVV